MSTVKHRTSESSWKKTTEKEIKREMGLERVRNDTKQLRRFRHAVAIRKHVNEFECAPTHKLTINAHILQLYFIHNGNNRNALLTIRFVFTANEKRANRRYIIACPVGWHGTASSSRLFSTLIVKLFNFKSHILWQWQQQNWFHIRMDTHLSKSFQTHS